MVNDSKSTEIKFWKWFSGLWHRTVQQVDINAPKEHVSSIVKTDPVDGSSVFPIKLAPTFKTTQCKNPEDYNLNDHFCGQLT